MFKLAKKNITIQWKLDNAINQLGKILGRYNCFSIIIIIIILVIFNETFAVRRQIQYNLKSASYFDKPHCKIINYGFENLFYIGPMLWGNFRWIQKCYKTWFLPTQILQTYEKYIWYLYHKSNFYNMVFNGRYYIYIYIYIYK